MVSKFVFKLKRLLRRASDFILPAANKPLLVNAGACEGLRLHLGAGPINLHGWVNVDARVASHIHLQANDFELKEFSDGALAEIYMCHVLEHFSFDEVEKLLRNFGKKLKPGGILRLSVPDFDKLIQAYQANSNDLELVKRALMGGQDYEYNFHKSVYNLNLLSSLMQKCGYVNPEPWTTESDFGCDLGDWSNKCFATPTGDFPVSLNLKASFSHK